MRLAVLGSGSRGNALAVTADGFTLLLDAGFSRRSLKRRARAARLDLATIGAVVLSHEHQDHARAGASLATALDCPVYASAGTLDRLGIAGVVLSHLQSVVVGPFTVTSCRVLHDAAEPLAFSIVGPEGAKLGLAYDLGEAGGVVRYLLRGARCLMVEANHDEAMLRGASYPPSVRYRIGGRHGHLSNRAAGDLLNDLCHPELSAVVLAHLSEECNRPDLAVGSVSEALAGRFGGTLYAAQQGEPLAALVIEP